MKHLFKTATFNVVKTRLTGQPFFYTSFFALLALGLIIGSYVLGWTTPTQTPPNGNVSACHLTHFDDTPPAETCPTGYYTYDAVAASSTGYMMCCRVDNPI